MAKLAKLPSYCAVFFAAALLAGCGRPVVGPAPEPEIIEGYVEQAPEPADVSGLGDDAAAEDDGDSLAHRVVYFDFDSSLLTLQGETVVRAHARHLRSALGTQVVLEGHADERGTREYNLALSEDRAKSVANFLQALGISPGRVQTVSYGEERPVALGHDESAWRLNRRVEILYQ